MKVVKVSQVPAEAAGGRLFTGPVTRQTLITGEQSKQFIINQINFAKGVRNKFHTHTNDQVLIVTAGKGIIATEQTKQVIEVGDIVHIPAGVKHWHGATEDSDFSHIAVDTAESKLTPLED